jgi:hypothetical protein
VYAACPDCGGALTTFSRTIKGQEHTIIIDRSHQYRGTQYSRILYFFMQCGGCGRGALAKAHDNGRVFDGPMEDFYPKTITRAPLPPGVPEGVVNEFREAELCASVDAWRAASALIRSALEKTLRANGYIKGTLEARIDEAAADGIITAARQRRAHDNVRVLGNDILHEDWHPADPKEYEDAHHYVQRILEDFYDQRKEVEVALIAKGRIKPIVAPPSP